MDTNDYQAHTKIYHKNPAITMIIGIVMILLSGTCAVLAYFSHLNPANNKGYIETTATIIDHYVKYDEMEDDYMYTPIAEFEVDGEVYEVISNSSSSIPSMIGKQVTILYNPQNPGDAFFKTSSFLFILIMVVTIIILGCGIVVLVRGIKHAKNIEHNV